MTRRIVCWLTKDRASAIAAKLAIRENEQHKLPLVVVTECDTRMPPWLAESLELLGVPVVRAAYHRDLYTRHDDVHVIGVPVDEQGRYDALTVKWKGAPLLEVLADRALRRDDVGVLWRRFLRDARTASVERARAAA